MKFSAISLAALIGLSLTTGSQAIELPQITLRDGSQVQAVPLPPRRMQGGSAYAIVTHAAARYGVPQQLAHAVIRHESGHNCRARNRSGASGLGQLMPGTARAMGVRNSFDCHQNADGSMRYLASMLRKAGGNWCAAATGYNRGSVGGCSAYGRAVLRHASI